MQPSFPLLPQRKNLLIAPLCWGLGHATRCIPLIRHYRSAGKNVVIASDNEALALLRAEFPDLIAVELPSYNIRYPSQNMLQNILPQLPHILATIWRERQATAAIVQQYNIDTIISDNRYGCFFYKNTNICNVFISHQINIKINSRTESTTFMEKIVGAMHRTWLNIFFNETWIPDIESRGKSLGGQLSHGKMPKKHHFIGILSRFSLIINKNKTENKPEKTRIAAVLSGPEPQRTHLENEILAQAKLLPNYTFTIVQGKTTSQKQTETLPNHLQIIPFLTADALQTLLENTDIVVARAGYSTLMDLEILQKNALLIPTPGQTEQEYLAHRLRLRPQFVVQTQDKIDLKAAFEQFQNL